MLLGLKYQAARSASCMQNRIPSLSRTKKENTTQLIDTLVRNLGMRILSAEWLLL